VNFLQRDCHSICSKCFAREQLRRQQLDACSMSKWKKTGNYCADRIAVSKNSHHFRYFLIHLARDGLLYARNCGRCRDTTNRHSCISRAIRFIELKGFGIWLFDTFVPLAVPLSVRSPRNLFTNAFEFVRGSLSISWIIHWNGFKKE